MTITGALANDLLKAFWIALAVSSLGAYPIWRLLLLTKSRQTISEFAPEAHQAKQGTPTMGGLIIAAGYIAFLVASYFMPIGQGPMQQPVNSLLFDKLRVPALILFIGFCLIGFVDDFVVPRLLAGKRGLGWKQKILMQLAIAILSVGLYVNWQPTSCAIGVFCVLFYSNAYNFADGIDALAGTLLLGLVLGIAGVSLMTMGGGAFAVLVLPLAGAVIPFLFLNAPPAKVFMGDAGSLPIGAILGFTIACLNFELPRDMLPNMITVAMPGDMGLIVACVVLSVMMLVELVPVPLQILSVKLRKKKLFPYTPIHHAFEKAGWPETRVMATFALVQLVVSLAAIAILYVRSISKLGT